MSTALDLLASHPEIDDIRPGKPLGVLEVAAASCSNDALRQLIATRGYTSERLAAASKLCGDALYSAAVDPGTRGILLSEIEARELQTELAGSGLLRTAHSRTL